MEESNCSTTTLSDENVDDENEVGQGRIVEMIDERIVVEEVNNSRNRKILQVDDSIIDGDDDDDDNDDNTDVWQLAMDEKTTAMMYRGKSNEYDRVMVQPTRRMTSTYAAATSIPSSSTELSMPGAFRVISTSRQQSRRATSTSLAEEHCVDVHDDEAALERAASLEFEEPTIVIPKASLVVEGRGSNGNGRGEDDSTASQLSNYEDIDLEAYVTPVVRHNPLPPIVKAVEKIEGDGNDEDSRAMTAMLLVETKRRKAIRCCILMTLLVIAASLIAILVSIDIDIKGDKSVGPPIGNGDGHPPPIQSDDYFTLDNNSNVASSNYTLINNYSNPTGGDDD